MNRHWKAMVELFSPKENGQYLRDTKKGIEKEGLRVTPQGALALTPHPEAFGDKTENAYITTDFSESQMELITPPFRQNSQLYDFLLQLHRKTALGLGEELLWPFSMPGRLPPDNDIPLARYNNTKMGSDKELYRKGLALRYGKKMQMISGIHYNFSFGPEFWEFLYSQSSFKGSVTQFKDRTYFHMARNYFRYRWLLLYLFGASPIADESFEQEIYEEITRICDCYDEIEHYRLYITTLRMSCFGYSSHRQCNPSVSFNTPEQYIKDLRYLLNTKHSYYGNLQNYDAEQLNGNILQLESEFYSPLRFKSPGEGSHLDNMERKGIEYIELRTFDLDPFEITGIGLEQIDFIESFMIFCLLEDSPFFTKEELKAMEVNNELTALIGRTPGLLLRHYQKGTISLRVWGMELLNKIEVAGKLQGKGSLPEEYKRRLAEPWLLPSARIMEEVKKSSYQEVGVKRAGAYKRLSLKSHEEVSYELSKS